MTKKGSGTGEEEDRRTVSRSVKGGRTESRSGKRAHPSFHSLWLGDRETRRGGPDSTPRPEERYTNVRFQENP